MGIEETPLIVTLITYESSLFLNRVKLKANKEKKLKMVAFRLTMFFCLFYFIFFTLLSGCNFLRLSLVFLLMIDTGCETHLDSIENGSLGVVKKIDTDHLR